MGADDVYLTIGIIGGAIGIITIFFRIYNYFKDPQERMDKRMALSETEEKNRATTLAQQLEWEKQANEKRFCELSKMNADALTLAQNHIHSLDLKTDEILKFVNAMNLTLTNSITSLSTIIDERIPKQK